MRLCYLVRANWTQNNAVSTWSRGTWKVCYHWPPKNNCSTVPKWCTNATISRMWWHGECEWTKWGNMDCQNPLSSDFAKDMPGLLLRAGQRYCKFVHYMLEYLHWDSIMVIQTNVKRNNDNTIFLQYKQFSFLKLQNGANVCTCLVFSSRLCATTNTNADAERSWFK